MYHRILRLPEVKKITGLSRSSIYLRMATEEFPKSISLGDRAVGWLEQDVCKWIEEKVEQSRGDDRGKS